MTDNEIIKKIETSLSVKLEKLRNLSARPFDKAAYYVNQKGAVIGFAFNNMFATDVNNIFDLIRHFDNLIFLSTGRGPINLEILESFKTLRELDISGGSMSNITTLRHLSFLEKLNISGNQINDLSLIEGCQLLRELDTSDNNIENINALRNLTALQKLDLSNNKVTDISPLQNLTSLEELYLNVNTIDDISVLQLLSSLSSLGLFRTKIKSVDPISKLKNLKKLFVGDNGSIDLSSLPKFESLEALYLGSVNKHTNNFISSWYGDDKTIIDISVVKTIE